MLILPFSRPDEFRTTIARHAAEKRPARGGLTLLTGFRVGKPSAGEGSKGIPEPKPD
jgi:hypothetical protein